MPHTPPSPEGNLPRWLRAILAAMALVQVLVAVAALVSERSSLFGLPAGPVRVGAAAAALLLSSVAGLAWARPSSRALVQFYAVLCGFRRWPPSLALVGLLAVPAAIYLPARWIGYPLLSVQFLLAALAVYLAGPRAREEQHGWWEAAALAVVIAAGVGLRVTFMLAGVADDEGSFVNTGINLLHGGGVAPEMWYMPASAPHMPAWGYAVALYGPWMRLFGVGLMQARSLGLVAGLLALPLVYLAVKTWYGSRAAWVTAALAAVSFLGIQASLGRMNGLPTLMVAGALLVHVWACQQERLLPHTLAGLAAVLTLEGHMLSLSIVAALGGYYLAEYAAGIRRGEKWLRPAPLWAYLAGAVPGLAAYAAAHILILPNPAGYLRYLSTFGDTAGLADAVLRRLANTARRWRVFWDQSPAEVVLIAASLAAALVRRARADRHWLALVLFNELALVAIHPVDIVNNGYMGFNLALLLGGSGALVTRGFGRDARPGSAWERVTLAGAALLLASYTAGAIRTSHQNFTEYDGVRRALAAAIRERVPPGETVLALDYYVPYLLDYRIVMPPGADDSDLAPALAGEAFDAYWLGMFLERWPRARLETHYFQPSSGLNPGTLTGSYFAARGTQHPMDWLWVVPDDGLVTDAPYAQPTPAALQMVAHVPPPEAAPGSSFDLHTIWVTRAAIEADYQAALALVDGQGRAIDAGRQALTGGWAGTATAQWRAYRFYDVAITASVPPETAPGTYRLHLALAPSGAGAACAPGCMFDVGEVRVGP